MKKRSTQEMELDAYKRSSIKAAKELGYSKKIRDEIKSAKSVSEIANIMKTARYNFWEKYDFLDAAIENEHVKIKRTCTTCKYSKRTMNMMPCCKCERHSKWQTRKENCND